MQKENDEGKDEAGGRAHDELDKDEEDHLDECPHVHLPQRCHLDEGSVRKFGWIRDHEPDTFPELVSSEVGPSVVEKETL